MTRAGVFADETYDAALKIAGKAGKLLIVDATATWCAPCKVMDRVTWQDPAVERWVAAHAIAIQFDVDQQAELAQVLAVRAMPTVIVFRDGMELDRVVGLKKPAELLAWLDGLLGGETELARLERTARNEPTNIDARYDLAKQLVSAGRHAEATDEFAWLWSNMLEHEPAMVGVRGSFMLGELAELFKLHPPARERFQTIREELGAAVRSGGASADQIRDWFDVSQLLREPEGLLEWYDASPELLDTRPDLEGLLRQKVVVLLLAKGRWADAAKLFRDPLALLREAHEFAVETEQVPLPEDMDHLREHVLRAMEEGFLNSVGIIHAALVAAGRDAEAGAVADEARRLRPTADVSKALAEMLEKAKMPAV